MCNLWKMCCFYQLSFGISTDCFPQGFFFPILFYFAFSFVPAWLKNITIMHFCDYWCEHNSQDLKLLLGFKHCSKWRLLSCFWEHWILTSGSNHPLTAIKQMDSSLKQTDLSFVPLLWSLLWTATLHSTERVGTGRGPGPGWSHKCWRGSTLGTCISSGGVSQQVEGVVNWEKPLLTWLFLSPQHPVELLPCCSGPAVPLLLAAHLHSCPALIHDWYRVLPYPLPGGTALQLAAQTQGPARGGGRSWHNCLPGVRLAVPRRGLPLGHKFLNV